MMYDDDEAGAGGLGSSAPDTASENYDDDESGADGLGSSAPNTASENYDDDEARAGGLGSSASDTASDDEALGLVVVEAVLPMPPVVTGADFLGSSAPNTSSNIGLW